MGETVQRPGDFLRTESVSYVKVQERKNVCKHKVSKQENSIKLVMKL